MNIHEFGCFRGGLEPGLYSIKLQAMIHNKRHTYSTTNITKTHRQRDPHTTQHILVHLQLNISLNKPTTLKECILTLSVCLSVFNIHFQ